MKSGSFTHTKALAKSGLNTSRRGSESAAADRISTPTTGFHLDFTPGLRFVGLFLFAGDRLMDTLNFFLYLPLRHVRLSIWVRRAFECHAERASAGERYFSLHCWPKVRKNSGAFQHFLAAFL